MRLLICIRMIQPLLNWFSIQGEIWDFPKLQLSFTHKTYKKPPPKVPIVFLALSRRCRIPIKIPIIHGFSYWPTFPNKPSLAVDKTTTS